MRSLFVTITEIWPLVTFGDMPQYFPLFWGEEAAVNFFALRFF